MNGNGNPNGAGNGETPESMVVIRFAAPGAAEFGIKTQNVTPAQLLGAAAWLDWYARRIFEAQAARAEEAQRIAVPGVSIPSLNLSPS